VIAPCYHDGAMAVIERQRPMRFKFDEVRATQAAAILIHLAGDQSNYTKMLKLLYLADRQSLQEVGAPIAGASFCNMANGPLASDIYNCIREPEHHEFWSKHIVRVGKYDVKLVANPDDGKLSDYDVDLLTALHRKYERQDFGDMIDIVHTLPEWVDPGATSVPLEPEEILQGAGVDGEAISEYRERNQHLAYVDELLA